MKFGLKDLPMEGEPGAGGGGAAIDEARVNAIVNGALAKFKTEVPKMFESVLTPLTQQLTEMGASFTSINEKLATTPPPVVTPPNASAIPPEVNAQLLQLTRGLETANKKLADSEKQREIAEKQAVETDKAAKVRSALAVHNYASPEAAEDAFSLINGMIERDANGKLVADGLPLEDFVKDFIPKSKAYLLAPTGRSGAGASAGQARGGQQTFGIDGIKPGMSAEDSRSAAGAIVAALRG